jgi:hypothetical protein
MQHPWEPTTRSPRGETNLSSFTTESTPMFPRTRSLACLVLLVCFLPGQDILRGTPADAVAYARLENPWKTLSSLYSGFLPATSPEEASAQTEEMLEMSNGLIGLEAGTMSGWMKSVTVIEYALTGLRPGDVEPGADWTAAFHTPLAEAIYDKISRYLEEQAFADRDEKDGFTSVTVDENDLLIKRHEDMLIVASSKSRLDAALAGLRSSPAEGLGKGARFRRVAGEPAGPIVLYGALSRLIPVILEEDGLPVPSMARTMAVQLGLSKLEDAGYRENESGESRLVVAGSGPVPAFEILSAKPAPPDLLHKLPVDTTMAFAWHGSPAELWTKGGGLLLDRERCVMAPLIEEQARSLQQTLGIKLSDLFAGLVPGMVIGCVTRPPPPSTEEEDRWRYRPLDLAWFVSGRGAGDGEGVALLRKVVAVVASRAGVEVATETAGEWTLLVPGGERGLAAAFQGDRFIIGELHAVHRVQVAADAEEPGLGRLRPIQGLQEASAHGWLDIGAIPAFQMLADKTPAHDPNTGLAFSMDITPDRITIASKRGFIGGLFQLPILFLMANSHVESEEVEAFEVEAAPLAEPPAPAPEPEKGK